MSEQSDANVSHLNGWKEDPVMDGLTHKTDDSPVPGTSETGGICRRTSKELKRSSPDQVEGHLMMLYVNLYFASWQHRQTKNRWNIKTSQTKETYSYITDQTIKSS